MSITNNNKNESCPVCGKACRGRRRGNVLTVKCPTHGRVRHDYESGETEVLE